MKDNYCVIMAGGVGSRFWPLSRTTHPKQFIDILGIGKSLLQQTFDRFKKICPIENILVVTNSIYENLVAEQLPEILKHNVLLEPMKRNTAPCIDYANFKILAQNPNAKIVVAPSDHLILNEPEFIRVINNCLEYSANHDTLLTIGIKPSRPETGYGYIKVGADAFDSNEYNISKVVTFTEKPEIEMAKLFFNSGDYFWNSGIFVWSLQSIMKAFAKSLPEVHGFFEAGIEHYNTENETKFIEDTYTSCRNISIDYGVMESADNVFVHCADFGWSDLGTWGSLHENRTKDEDGNTVSGKNVFKYETKNCIIHASDNKLVVVQGMEDAIVVDSCDTLLVCKKENEQQIKRYVSDVRLKTGDKYI